MNAKRRSTRNGADALAAELPHGTRPVEGASGPRPLPAAASAPAAGSAVPPRATGTLVSLLAPSTYEAEQYRILRYHVERRHQDDGLRVLAVSSADGDEGKSTTAINLAGALAQSPQHRVLLVEADLRRPSILRQLGLPDGGPGLAEATLDPTLTPERITVAVPPFNLRVLPAGRPAMAPYEILRTPRLALLIGDLRAAYDYVVVDTPPVLPCPDYRVLEPLVDGVILVVTAGRTRRERLTSAVGMVEASKLLGLAFNGERRPPAGYRGYYHDDTRRQPRLRLPWAIRQE